MASAPRPARRAPLEVGVLLELAALVRSHLGRLTPGERAHVLALLRKSGGRPSGLTKAERRDIGRLVGKLDVPAFGRAVRPLAGRLRPR